MAFLGLAWHHLGLCVEISRLGILMAFLGLAWNRLVLYVEISRLLVPKVFFTTITKRKQNKVAAYFHQFGSPCHRRQPAKCMNLDDI